MAYAPRPSRAADYERAWRDEINGKLDRLADQFNTRFEKLSDQLDRHVTSQAETARDLAALVARVSKLEASPAGTRQWIAMGIAVCGVLLSFVIGASTLIAMIVLAHH